VIRVGLIVLISVIAGAMPAAAQQRTCVQLRLEYDAGAIPKAYAAAPNDKCGFATGRSASTLAQAKAKALEYCIGAGGVKCRVVSSQGR
jgi:hypothetical protein